MKKLVDVLPALVAELAESLIASGRADVAGEVANAWIDRATYDPSCNAAYIHLRSSRELNAVERNIIGTRHGETLRVEHPYEVNIDVDRTGRVSGIELLNGSAVEAKLREYLTQ
jgi:uncharacterized protein YuzE